MLLRGNRGLGVDMSFPNKGISVPEEVREILTRNYAMYQCLKMKIINFHSLAELIQTQVQEVTGRKASVNTLVVAIKRFSDTLQDFKTPSTSKVLKGARISLSSDIVDVTIKAPRTQFSKIVTELSQAASELSEFPHLFPLANSIKMILPAEDFNLIRAKHGALDVAVIRPNVAKLMLTLSSSAEMTPGIASYVTEVLYRNGVNILDAFLGYGDIVIVVDQRDGPLAYDVLQREAGRSDDSDTRVIPDGRL